MKKRKLKKGGGLGTFLKALLGVGGGLAVWLCIVMMPDLGFLVGLFGGFAGGMAWADRTEYEPTSDAVPSASESGAPGAQSP